jgi:hypothetical protein
MLVIDNATVRLIVDGSTVYQRDDTRCIRAPTRYGSGIVCGPHDPVSAAPGTGTASAFFQLNLPFDVYERVRDRPLQIEIDFALTLLGRTGKATVAGRERQWFDVGDSRCLAQRDASGWEVQLHCLHTTRVPACRRTLIDTGIEHSIRTECRSDYAPFVVHKFPDVIDRGTPAMSAAQILGMNPSPQIGPDSSVRLETYAPRAYFRRSIAIPSIRFSDQIANAESRRAVLRQ